MWFVLLSLALLVLAPSIPLLRPLWIAFWVIAAYLPVGLRVGTWFGRGFALLRTGLTLLLIFSVRPMDLRPEFKKFGEDSAIGGKTSRKDQSAPSETTREERTLVWMEHAKAVDEIKQRGAQEDTWFQYKFGLIGALVVGVTVLKLRSGSGDAKNASLPPEPEKGAVTLKEFWYSPASGTLLAVACVAALACDIHVRSSSCVTNQLGLWIAHFAEPTLSGQPFDAKNVHPFVPWEQFLRIEPQGAKDAGMHTSEIWSLSFWPHFHFLTAMIFGLYRVLFQDLCLERRRWNQGEDREVGPLVLWIVQWPCSLGSSRSPGWRMRPLKRSLSG